MKDLSITQKYLICTVNEKGVLPSYDQNAAACLIVSGVLEMQLEKCISLEDKKITVCAGLPKHMAYLKPLYDVIDQGKPVKAEKVVEAYTLSFSSKKLNELFDALMDGLKDADAVEPAKAGLLKNKDTFAPKKEVITGIIEKIRAELSADGEISEETAALTVLLDKAGNLNKYLSKFEQKEWKAKLDKIRKGDAGTFTKEVVQYIDGLAAWMVISSAIIPATV